MGGNPPNNNDCQKFASIVENWANNAISVTDFMKNLAETFGPTERFYQR